MQEQFTLWEEWRPVPVPGYEAHYEVSNLGRIRRASPAKRTRPGNLLKPRPTRLGYLMAAIYDAEHQRVDKPVHVLVAGAFVGPCPVGYEVNHKDGDKANNTVANLEYRTHAENMQHAVAIGHPPGAKGSKNGGAKLTEDAVREIRSLDGNETPESLAARFEVGVFTIRRIQLRQVWKHVG